MKVRYFLFLCFFVFTCKGNQKKTLENIVNVRLEAEPDLLNPIISTKSFSKQIESQLFMPLLQYDSETLNLYPVLATSRPKVESITSGALKGGRKYIFEIRPEAKWDNGQPVLGEDFEFTLKAFLHPQIGHPGLRSFLGFIQDVKIDPLNPRRFTVITKISINLAEEVIGTMAIYPKHIYDPSDLLEKHEFDVFANANSIAQKVEADAALSLFATKFKATGQANTFDQINACGPYQVSEWLPGERVILEKKDNWWAKNLKKDHQSFCNYPDQLIYYFIEEDATLSTLLKAQNIDVAASIDPSIFDVLKTSDLMQQYYNFYSPSSPSYYFIAFNTKNPKLESKETRLAISYLMNIDEAINVAMSGYGERTIGPILPVKPYYNKKLKPIGFDIGKAKSLLSIAGWSDENQDGILEKEIDGERTNFSIEYKYTNNNSVAGKIGLLLKANAQKVGIEITLSPLEFNKLVQDTRRRDFGLYCSRWSQSPGLDDLRSIWHTESDTPTGFNKTGFGNFETDELIDSINIVLDSNKRTKMYHDIQRIIYEQQPYLFLFVPTERIIVHKRFDTKTSVLRPGYWENTFRLKE